MRIYLSGNPSESLDARVREAVPGAEVLTAPDLEQAPERLAEVEIVYGGLKADEWPRARSLRWLQATGAGVNSLLTPDVVRSEVTITTASGIHAEPIAEHMFGMLLAHTRWLTRAWDQQRERSWNSRGFSDRLDMLAGKTLGILGVGAIGSASARVGAAFRMRVLGLRRSRATCEHVERMFTPDQRLAFFAETDVVMNSLPLTPNTRGFMGEAELGALPPGAIVINTGRGGTIDTDALVAALRGGRLGAALLDVTDPEPLPSDHPLWTMDNVLITPHYAGAHPGYADRAAAIFLDNLRRYRAGEPLVNVVDKEEGY